MDIVLADLEIEGRDRQVILHAPKNGFFYVIDRTNGELISAEPFTEVTWATHVDLETGRPVEVAGARYEDGTEIVAPGPVGGHNWHAMSYNPGTGLAYIPTIHASYLYTEVGIDLATFQSVDYEGGMGVTAIPSRWTHPAGHSETLQAWDPVSGEQVWEVPLEGLYNPGTLTTAGNLVFQGRVDGTLRAYRADTGEEVWRTDLGLGISAPPITYSVGGKQYVALLVGWGGAVAGVGGAIATQLGWAYGAQTRMLVAFTLDGTAELPPPMEPVIPEPVEMQFEVDAGLAATGERVYGLCAHCHGPLAVSGGMAPDLRASQLVASAESFAGVVRDGNRAVGGMPAYRDFTDDMLLALRHYVRREAEAALPR